MDTHRIYDLIVVHLIKCICNSGPRAVNMPQAPRHLNLVLVMEHLRIKTNICEYEHLRIKMLFFRIWNGFKARRGHDRDFWSYYRP